MKMLSNRTGGYLPALILAVMLTIGISAPKVQAQNGYNNNYGDNYYGDNYDSYNNGSYQDFYNDLAPYGQWLNDPQYGYVWTPNVGRDFRPYYTNGYWVMTDYGNMWVSNYNWGWAPFHYGRWAQSSYYGWIWIPGNEWGPAWVNWRQGGGYYGWAPMGPGVSINFSFGSGYNVPNPWWTFIPCGNIYSRSFYRYYAPRRTVNIINNTTIINHTYVDNRTRTTYVTGPRRSDVETATRQRVTVYNVNNGRSAGATNVSGRNVNVYRPQVGTGRGNNTQAGPRQVKTLERSAVTNTGGGRQPVRASAVQDRGTSQPVQPATRGRQSSSTPQLEQRSSNSRAASKAIQQRNESQLRSAQQRDQQVQLQQQRNQQQAEQQRNAQRQQLQQQQNVERQQVEQQRNVQRQQLQQQNAERQQAEQQRNSQRQQMEQERNAQRQQAEQQRSVQRQQMEQQRNAERQQLQQQRSVERSQAQPQQRAAPASPQRSVERAPRGR